MAKTPGSAFSAEEKAAMKAAVSEATRGKGSKAKERDRQACLDQIAAMDAGDRALAEAVHRIVTTEAPGLDVKTWYGMPAYASDGKVVVFFKSSGKFQTRYSTLGFEQAAQLDDGACWPTAFALTAIDDKVEAQIADLVKRAVGAVNN